MNTYFSFLSCQFFFLKNKSIRLFSILFFMVLGSLLQAAPEATASQIETNFFPALSSPGSLISVLTAGGWVMLPLGILSVITVALIFVYFVTLRSRAVVTHKYMSAAEILLKKNDLLGLLALSNQHSEVVPSIMSRSVSFLAANPQASLEEVREVAQTEGTREANILHQRISWLSDIATIAPMLGLLGTVFGMIRSFSVMANDVAGTRPMLLAEGVAQALVATAVGLIVGISAMVAYSLFKSRVQSMISDMEAACTQLLALFPKKH